MSSPLESQSSKSLEQQWEEYVDNFDEPTKEKAWATDGLWRLVGNGKQTDDSCGTWKGWLGCVNDEAHSKTMLDGRNFDGLAVVKYKHKTCYDYSCPVCYLSWAVRGAHRITDKLESFGVKFGVADHIVLSFEEDYFLSTDEKFEKLCKTAVKAMQKRGIVGGVMIFHGFRYADKIESIEKNVPFGWRWSPHFHILGFIQNKREFYKKTAEEYKKDHILVKLKDKRETVFGTAWYQLNHASIMFNEKHFEVARWFGEVHDPRSKTIRENNKKVKLLKKDTNINIIQEIIQLEKQNKELLELQKIEKKNQQIAEKLRKNTNELKILNSLDRYSSISKQIIEAETENKELKHQLKELLNKDHTQKCPICCRKMVKLTYYGLRKDLQRSLQECRKQRDPTLKYWEDEKGKKSKTIFLDKIIDSENQCLNWAET